MKGLLWTIRNTLYIYIYIYIYVYGNNNNDIYTWGYFNICAVDPTYQQRNPFYSTAFSLLITRVNNRFVSAITAYQQQRTTQNSTICMCPCDRKGAGRGDSNDLGFYSEGTRFKYRLNYRLSLLTFFMLSLVSR